MDGSGRVGRKGAAALRIALVAPPFVRVPPEGYGGTELVVADLARSLVEQGHEVTLFASGDSRLPDCRLEALYPRPVWPPEVKADWNHAVFAAERIAAEGFDVVHAHTPALLPLAQTLQPPVIYTVHHPRQHEDVYLHGKGLARLYREAPAVHFACISARQAQLFADVLARPARVVHHGLDVARYRAGTGDGGHGLFLGRFDAVKAPHLALAAAREAGIALHLAGRPHDADYFARVLSPALADGGARLVGEVCGEAKIQALGSASVLLFPSVWEEPFGLALVEAMLCGTPVVALRRGAVAELVDEGVTGYSVDDARELGARVHDALRLDRAQVRARAQARFSRTRMASEYLQLYRDALRLGEEAQQALGG